MKKMFEFRDLLILTKNILDQYFRPKSQIIKCLFLAFVLQETEVFVFVCFFNTYFQMYEYQNLLNNKKKIHFDVNLI